jgi:hypothetical protein
MGCVWSNILFRSSPVFPILISYSASYRKCTQVFTCKVYYYYSLILNTLEFYRQILVKIPGINFFKDCHPIMLLIVQKLNQYLSKRN